MSIGDYVRTKDYLDNQLICKIDKIIDEYCINTDKGYWDNEHILKSSPNIIDLIEVGDYVNGHKVIGLEKDNDNKEYLQCGVGDYVVCTYYEEDIKSIVTHQQFDAMKYEVK